MKIKSNWYALFMSASILFIGATRLLGAEVESCNLEKTAKADQGYVCKVSTQSGNVFWWLEAKTETGKRVWRDLRTELLVSDVLDRGFTQYDTKYTCTDPSSLEIRGNISNAHWRLPTGYPKNSNGQGFPNEDSDFVVLEADGIREVVSGIQDKWFWSSSVSPTYSGSAYDFNGSDGKIYSGTRDKFLASVLCVGQ